MAELNPLGVRMICETCGRSFPRDCQCPAGQSKPSAFLPLRLVPDATLEKLREPTLPEELPEPQTFAHGYEDGSNEVAEPDDLLDVGNGEGWG